MRDYLAPVLAAIATPPHLPAQYFEQARKKFESLEAYITNGIYRAKEVSQALESLTGDRFRDPVRDLPSRMWSMLSHLRKDERSWEPPVSNRIQEFQQFSGMEGLRIDTLSSIIKRMAELPKDRSEYSEFFKAYAEFLKDYTYFLGELQSWKGKGEVDPDWSDYWEPRYEGVIQGLQSYRSSLDALYKYVNLYLSFARQVDAYQIRREMQIQSYFNSSAYPERKQRPPHKQVEVLYHASVNLPSILQSGFRTRKELGEESAALGGGPDDVISFTADIAIARSITDALRDVVKIARGEMDFDDVVELAQQDGVPTDKFDDTRRNYAPMAPGLENEWRNSKRLAFEAYRSLLAFTMKRYNPAFFGVHVENFANVESENIGILAAKVDMSQVTEYLREMEEFRVPPIAVLSMKKVPY